MAMSRRWCVGALPWVGLAVLAWLAGCRGLESNRVEKPITLPDITPSFVDYVDTDAFDRVFESSLVNQDPVVIVRSGSTTADWGSRLNAWIAAWNQGSKGRGKTVRGQAPLPKVVIDGESIRELRLLVNGLLDRIEDVAHSGSTWYRDQRERSRRVALLKPYNLRFHKGEDGTIQLIFFHEMYSAYYPRFLQKLMDSETIPPSEWTRSIECSECKSKAEKRIDRLVGRGG